MTNEMGMPIKEERSEVEKCAWVMEYFAQWKSVCLILINGVEIQASSQ
jgi:hypothetical protein